MKYSFPKDKIKIVLSEKIHPAADEIFSSAGYSVTRIDQALDQTTDPALLDGAHVIGIRSRSKLDDKIIQKADKLLAIGCFSVGTDAVDLYSSCSKGAPVFNAPHSSTRSVAELAIGNIFSLARSVGDKNNELHAGVWEKNAKGSREIRNKVLGIIGYGHIGQQVGLLAEAIGMQVIFYDVLKKLPLGRNYAVESIEDVFTAADFVSIHVPGIAENENLIGKHELKKFRKGACLLNLSRGNIIDIKALEEALKNGHLAGAALDVYPEEPASNSATFTLSLAKLPNVILTPHIGGSTEEAQENIGREVAIALVNYLDFGSTDGAVNFPQVRLPSFPDRHRILHIHKNVPGVLTEVNKIISDLGINIEAQFLNTRGNIGYLIMDVNKDLSDEARNRIAKLEASIKTRILYS